MRQPDRRVPSELLPEPPEGAETESKVRNPLEVQQAHDLLYQLVVDGLGKKTGANANHIKTLHSWLDVLCWVLGHGHNDSFEENITAIQEHLASLGYDLVLYPRIMQPDELESPDEEGK